jgi:hypothetical protein
MYEICVGPFLFKWMHPQNNRLMDHFAAQTSSASQHCHYLCSFEKKRITSSLLYAVGLLVANWNIQV